MCCRDIGSFVAPDRPCAERELNKKEYDPPDRQSPQRPYGWGISPNPQTKYNYRDRDENSEKAMRHLQPNLKRGHVGISVRIAPDVDLHQRGRACVRNPRAVGRGKIENGKVAMLMAHGCAERELQVDGNRRCEGKRLKWCKFLEIDNYIGERSPEVCRHQRDHNNESEKRLRQTGMKNSDFVFEHRHTQTAENALQNNAGDSNQTEIAYRLSILTAPNPDRENDGEKSNCGCNQAMSVLKKNPADPFRDRK